MITTLALDIDNTILNDHGQLSEATRRAIAAASAAKLRVILATARGYRSTAAIHRELGLTDPVICHAGALVYDFAQSAPLATWPLPTSMAVALGRLAEELQIGISAYVGSQVWFNRPPDCPLRSSWVVQDDFVDSLQQAPEVLEMVVVGSNDVHLFRSRLFERRLAAELSLTLVPDGDFTMLFIARSGIDKANALDWLFDRLGVRWAEVAACGDGTADIRMIERAGWGLAAPAANWVVRATQHGPVRLPPAEPIASLVQQILHHRW